MQRRVKPDALEKAFKDVWTRRVEKPDAIGIHGTLFYELLEKKPFYPNKADTDNPG